MTTIRARAPTKHRTDDTQALLVLALSIAVTIIAIYDLLLLTLIAR
jgi:hypothetical protein